MAATTGNAARRRSLSSPDASSRRISTPTTKKNAAMRPSLIQKCKGRWNDSCPSPIPSGVCQSAR
jgi:hypothetical protein